MGVVHLNRMLAERSAMRSDIDLSSCSDRSQPTARMIAAVWSGTLCSKEAAKRISASLCSSIDSSCVIHLHCMRYALPSVALFTGPGAFLICVASLFRLGKLITLLLGVPAALVPRAWGLFFSLVGLSAIAGDKSEVSEQGKGWLGRGE